MLFVSIVLSVMLGVLPTSGQDADVQTLVPDRKIERRIKAPQIHGYEIKLTAGTVLNVELREQNGFDCELVITDASGENILVKSNFGNGDEREYGTIVVPQTGVYTVVVIPHTYSLEGDYVLTARIKKSAGRKDKNRVAAGQLLIQAAAIGFESNDEAKIDEAISKSERAAVLWKKLNDPFRAATAYLMRGKLLQTRGEKEKSLVDFEQALALFKLAKNSFREAETLRHIAQVYAARNEITAAYNHYQSALTIFQKIGKAEDMGGVYFDLGLLSESSGDLRKALSYLEKGVAIFKRESAVRDEANARTKIGDIYFKLRNFTSAAENYQNAAGLSGLFDDRKAVGMSFNSIGLAQREAEKFSSALNSYHQALNIFREIEDKQWEAVALNNIAEAYSATGDNLKSLEFHERALTLRRAAGDRESLMNSLLNAGRAYSKSNNEQRALQLANEALELSRRAGNKQNEAVAMHLIGNTYSDSGDKQKALFFLNSALSLRRELQISADVASTLNALGYVYKTMGALKKALEFYEESLKLSRESKDRFGEATALNNIGQTYDESDNEKQALEYFNQSLAIKRELGDRSGEAVVLNNIGAAYRDLEETEKALEFFGKSLEIKRTLGSKTDEAATLDNIALVYSAAGENRKALEFLNISLPLRRATGDKAGEAATLNNFGLIYQNTGEKSKAIDFFNRSLEIRRAISDQIGVAVSLHNIGSVFVSLHEERNALEYFQQALEIVREIGSSRSEANLLNSIGNVHLRLKDWQKAKDAYTQSLSIYQKLENFGGTAGALNSLGVLLDELGDKQFALEYFKKALPIFRTIDDRGGEAQVLNNMGAVYQRSGNLQSAVGYYGEALPLRRIADDREGEAVTLGNLMRTYQLLGQTDLAIAYGKKSVSVKLDLRGKARGFDSEIQKRFLQRDESVYRRLAGLLMSAGRLSEAHQVLNSYKDQEFFDFAAEDAKQPTTLELTSSEKLFFERYESEAKKIVEIWRARNSDKKSDVPSAKHPAAAVNQSLTAADIQNRDQVWHSFIKKSKDIFQPDVAFDKTTLTTTDTRQLQTVLRELEIKTKEKSAVLYALADSEKFRILLITTDTAQTFTQPITRAELNAKAVQFWTALNSPAIDPRPLGRELYDIVFKAARTKLPAGTTTLMWNLDGSLRYVPPAAFYDGEKYLAESFQSVIFTRFAGERLLKDADRDPAAFGFGSTRAHKVSLSGEEMAFGALPAVRDELNGIFKAELKKNLSPTKSAGKEVYVDAEFTKSRMISALREKRPLVHIASHFAFRPGDDARSFLLLGDGTAFTLAEMKAEKNLFAGVQLLTLSACNTAAIRSDADGREIDGFAELAQRLGADAVIAGLWSVADESTRLLMEKFYEIRRSNTQITKAAALQQAQQLMISGKLQSNSRNAGCRSEVINLEGKTQNTYKCDGSAPFAHPFYWSPFVLIGNWR